MFWNIVSEKNHGRLEKSHRAALARWDVQLMVVVLGKCGVAVRSHFCLLQGNLQPLFVHRFQFGMEVFTVTFDPTGHAHQYAGSTMKFGNMDRSGTPMQRIDILGDYGCLSLPICEQIIVRVVGIIVRMVLKGSSNFLVSFQGCQGIVSRLESQEVHEGKTEHQFWSLHRQRHQLEPCTRPNVSHLRWVWHYQNSSIQPFLVPNIVSSDTRIP